MISKFALVIANTEYQDASFAKLTAPSRDAEEFAQVLCDQAMFEGVQTLLNEGEGRTRRSIARFFADRKHDDLLLLYFSGHGVRNEQGQLFLAANDTEMSILDASGIPAEFITSAMNNSRSQRQLLILDCCNSGAFAQGTKSVSAVGKSMGIATAFEGSGFGRVVLTATDATQYAWEGDKIIGDTQKSLFTHFLIEGLKGEADLNDDGCIDVDELFDYAYEQVVRRTPKQTPGKWSYKQQGGIILRENLSPQEVKPVPLPEDVLELLSHPNSSVRRAGIQDLITLMQGSHPGLARAAEEKLREIAEKDDSLTIRRTARDELNARGVGLDGDTTERFSKEYIDAKKAEAEKSQVVPVPEEKVEKKERKLNTGEKTLKPASSWKSITSRFSPRLLVWVGGGLLFLVLLFWGGRLLSDYFLSAPPAVQVQTVKPTALGILPPEQATSTPRTRPTEPAVQTQLPQTDSTPATLYDIGSSITGEDGMTLLYVPAGEFKMGSETSETIKAHQVYVDAFWIDKTEVTNRMYAACVGSAKCQPPRDNKSFSRNYGDEDYFGNPKYDNYPVIHISWIDAQAYCAWAGRRLPTEAEWEKAARGEKSFDYPWGNDPPTSELLNYKSNIGDTTEVGSYLKGASPYGALDMAGNVWEWVKDVYADYSETPSVASTGTDSNALRVLRGGSWYLALGTQPRNLHVIRTDDTIPVHTWYRNKASAKEANDYFGFRCAMSAAP